MSAPSAPVDDVLHVSGLLTLGSDPPMDAVETALQRLNELANGSDPLRREALREGAVQALKRAGISSVVEVIRERLGGAVSVPPVEAPVEAPVRGNGRAER